MVIGFGTIYLMLSVCDVDLPNEVEFIPSKK